MDPQENKRTPFNLADPRTLVLRTEIEVEIDTLSRLIADLEESAHRDPAAMERLIHARIERNLLKQLL